MKKITKKEVKKQLAPIEDGTTKLEEYAKFRSKAADISCYEASPSKVYEKGIQLIKKAKENNGFTDQESSELVDIVGSINVVNSHVFLLGVGKDKRDKTLILELAEDFIKEFDCKSTLERTLCEVLALHYYGIMSASRAMQGGYNLEYLSNVKNGYFGIIGKALEREQRMYLNTLQTLQSLKTPAMNISFKANTAFIAQNQQFNNQNDIGKQ